MTKLICSNALVDHTLDILRLSGAKGHEGIVLWLARRSETGDVEVVEAVEPEHRAAVDFFHIPPEGMNAIMQRLRKTRTRLVAQVHTHPGHAFHSKADDEWAIVRHEGALSLVVPHFAGTTHADSFLRNSAVFRLSANDRWEEVQERDYPNHVVIA